MAEGRPLFTAGEASSILGAALSGPAEARVLSVAVDSREAGPGSLFFALPGAKADGHDFVAAAVRAGASCVVARADRRAAVEAAAAEAATPARGSALIFVEDALAALQSLARAYRRRYPSILRVGITGSSGKTTTKECAAAILGRSRRVVANPGNLNSDIGLPLSVFAMDGGHEVGVFEMGMNRVGEMGELASVYEPDIALITNVGTAHIGIIGSRDGIAQEKKAVFSRFDGAQRGLVWEDDDYNAFLKAGVRGTVADFGPRSTRGFRGAEDRGLDGYRVDWEGLEFDFPLAGRHALLDAIAAMAVAELAGASPRDVADGLSGAKPLFGRGEILRGEVTLVRDCYNANPDSALAAMGFCDGLSWSGRRGYVLGSMLELGAETEGAHRLLGEAAGRSRAQALFFFGEETRTAFEAARAAGFRGMVVHETDFDRLRSVVSAWVREGDLVLLKGSRGVALERLSDSLGAKARNAGSGGAAPGRDS